MLLLYFWVERYLRTSWILLTVDDICIIYIYLQLNNIYRIDCAHIFSAYLCFHEAIACAHPTRSICRRRRRKVASRSHDSTIYTREQQKKKKKTNDASQTSHIHTRNFYLNNCMTRISLTLCTENKRNGRQIHFTELHRDFKYFSHKLKKINVQKRFIQIYSAKFGPPE